MISLQIVMHMFIHYQVVRPPEGCAGLGAGDPRPQRGHRAAGARLSVAPLAERAAGAWAGVFAGTVSSTSLIVGLRASSNSVSTQCEVPAEAMQCADDNSAFEHTQQQRLG